MLEKGLRPRCEGRRPPSNRAAGLRQRRAAPRKRPRRGRLFSAWTRSLFTSSLTSAVPAGASSWRSRPRSAVPRQSSTAGIGRRSGRVEPLRDPSTSTLRRPPGTRTGRAGDAAHRAGAVAAHPASARRAAGRLPANEPPDTECLDLLERILGTLPLEDMSDAFVRHDQPVGLHVLPRYPVRAERQRLCPDKAREKAWFSEAGAGDESRTRDLRLGSRRSTN